MSATIDFYLTRAAACAQDAEAATLDNVRERCLRAEAAWRTMADRASRLDAYRRTQAAGIAIRASEHI